ncbi:MAG: hypothetical protein GY765_42360 [bacterium]|nr:hypothetical protein [bacterium]
MKITIKRDSYTGSSQNYSYRVLTSSTRNDGSQTFTIPTNITAASDWRVWMVDVNGTAPAVHASGTITINESSNPNIYNVRPNYGTYRKSNSLSVSWSTTDISSSAYMRVSIKRDSYTGSSQNYSYRQLTSSTRNDGSQSFTIPTNITAASDWRVWVADVNGAATATAATGTITINEDTNPTISNVRPNYGTYRKSNSLSVSWSTSDISSSAYMIVSIKRDSYTGSSQNYSYRQLTTSIRNDGSQSFTIPSNITAASDWRVWVADVNGTATATAATGTITINEDTNPTISNVRPNYGTYRQSDSLPVSWSTSDISSSAYMIVSIKRDSYTGSSQNYSYRQLTTSTRNDGSQSFTLPTNITAASDWRVWVADVNGTATATAATGTITINESIVISNVRPTYGTYQKSGSLPVSWSAADISSSAYMIVSIKRDSYTGGTQNYSYRQLTTSARNDGSESFTIPTNITAASDWRVWVADTNGTATATAATGTITINDGPIISNVRPTSGTFTKTGNITVQWDTTNMASSASMKVSLKRHSYIGATPNDSYRVLTEGTPNDGIQPFPIPTNITAATDWEVWVGDAAGNATSVVAAGSITINGGTVSNVRPTSGTFQKNGNITVQWNTTNIASTASMKVSLKRLSYTGPTPNYSYRVLTEGTPNDGNQEFLVPSNITAADDWQVWVADASDLETATPAPTTITIEEAVPPPDLISPTSGASNVARPVEFSWNAVSGAQEYYIQVTTSTSGWSTSSGFSNPVHEQVVNGTSVSWSNAEAGSRYYWSARAGNASSGGDFSSYRTFVTGQDTPPPPTPISPVENAVDIQPPVAFSWGSVDGAERYHLQVASSDTGWDEVNGLQTIVFDNTINGTSLNWDVGDIGTEFFWCVRAENQAVGAYSQPRRFSVKTGPDAARFNDTVFKDGTAKPGIPFLLEAQLQSDTAGSPGITDQMVLFEINVSGTWQVMPEDAIATTAFLTGSDGGTSVYYTAPPDLAPGNYSIRVRFEGDESHGPCELQRALTVRRPQWLVMIYLCADNDLEDASVEDFYQEIFATRGNDDVSICVLYDRADNFSTQQPFGDADWTTTRYYKFASDLAIFTDWGEQNMGNANTLQSFVETATGECPAEHTALILWNHGSGWKREMQGTSTDFTELLSLEQIAPLPALLQAETIQRDSSGNGTFKGVCSDTTDNDELTLSEVRGVLDTMTNGGTSNLDILGYDACVMGMIEVAYDAVPYADYLVASEANESGDGWEYQSILAADVLTSATTPLAWGRVLVDQSIQETMGCWDLSLMDTRFNEIRDFSNRLSDLLQNAATRTMITDARTAATRFQSHDGGQHCYVDLRQFADEVAGNAADATLRTRARVVADGMSDTAFRVRWRSTAATAGTLGGLSIYFPEDVTDGGYANYTQNDYLLFTTSADQTWDDFLAAYFTDIQVTVDTSKDTLNVPEGGTAAFQVKLSQQPASNVSLEVKRLSGDSDISVQSGANLAFTAANWNVYRDVILAAGEDADTANGTAVFTIGASGVTGKSISVSEQDNDLLPGSITVTSPRNGDLWSPGGSYAIAWTAANLSGNVTVDLYKDGAFVVNISSAPVSGGATWNIPADMPDGNDYRIRVSRGAVEGYSTGYFSLLSQRYYFFHGNDFNGDGASDIAIYRPAIGRWCVRGTPSLAWGVAGDIPVPGDYDGDGTTDFAVFRPSTGRWCIMGQPSIAWGTATDIPVPGDYNGDGVTDIAIYRPSNGRWCIMGQPSIAWGTVTDVPMPADYDGDGATDIAIFRPSNGRWCIMGQPSIAWGTATDVPAPADFNGDGAVDIAIFRPSTGRWCIMGQPSIAWGTDTDIPVPADYDGDGDADIAIFRPSNGAWSIQGTPSIRYGVFTDIPLVSHRGK